MDEPQLKKPKYTKVSQLEHVLLRPDTYIGSTELKTEKLWVLDFETKHFVYRTISYVPGLYKIFDEILVNASDNYQRDKSMTKIEVIINKEENEISILNDGQSIPVEIDAKENVYNAELVFGHLLTSSNYDDNEKKVTGGRNGYGAKLCNIFSTEFVVETYDSIHKKSYKQIFKNNMSVIGKPIIKELKAVKKDFVKITFKPDLQKFGLTVMSDDIIALLSKRVYDIAGCNVNLKVYLNDLVIPIKNFKHYVELYQDQKNENKNEIIYEVVNDRWSIALTTVPPNIDTGTFMQCSFVNSINTIRGGAHVEYVLKPIITSIIDAISKKKQAKSESIGSIKPAQVKPYLWVFVNSLIENPAFDSQTKETLTTKPTQFGSNCVPSDLFIKNFIKKTTIIQSVTAFAAFKADKTLTKLDGKKKIKLTGIPKLDDANFAGSKNSHLCTLILTEGDSAKTLAVSGLSIIGRDKYGVYPLRGKLLNVREANAKQLLENVEINALKQILGLKQNVDYSSELEYKTLRYGHVMIMTDQDHDGSHIKGLIINFFAYFWNSLLKRNDFLQEFITPIVKIERPFKMKPIQFFTMTEYKNYIHEHPNTKKDDIKYYKGLGTNTREEAQEYFKNLDKHQISFQYQSNFDLDNIELAFNKKMAEQRKDWLIAFEPKTAFLVQDNVKTINYSDFINKELIHFSLADGVRSIPSVIDGMKPSFRKILFSCFKRNLTKDIKVAQLSGYVSEQSAYHHGEQSLQTTIITMARNYVGSNNIALLVPSGQFGTRLQGGKDHASPRYIFTRLNSITRTLFPSIDDPILNYLDEDGQSIEPQFYLPVLPYILINGADGIGTGWSTEIPSYNPLDICQNIKMKLNNNNNNNNVDHELEKLVPWYFNFKGTIIINPKKEGSYLCNGSYEIVDENNRLVRILELPIGSWTQDYKEFLESSLIDQKPDTGFLTDIKEYYNDTKIDFLVTFTVNGFIEFLKDPFQKLKLTKSISINNMHAFTIDNKIRKYTSPEEIIDEFIPFRLHYYQKRKDYLLKALENACEKISDQVKFILAIINNEIEIRGIAKSILEKQLENQLKLHKDPVENNYDYLLNMSLSSLTKEKVDQLLKNQKEKENEYNLLKDLEPKDLWLTDLKSFENEYKSYLDDLNDNDNDSVGNKKNNTTNKKRKRN